MAEQLPEAPRSGRGRSRGIAAGVLFFTLLSFGGWWAGRDLAAGPVPPRAPLGGARLFDQVLAAVSQKYVDSLSSEVVYDKAVSGLLRELNDPYTTFLSEARLGRLNEQISGTYAGVGLQFDIRDGWPIVIEPVLGGPSERAGVLPGDRIVQIDKESTRDQSREEASRALRGLPGSTVGITVQRGDQRMPFALVRDKVHLRAVQRVVLMPDGVGYVDVNVFSAQTANELRAAVDSVVKLGARSLVVDLRGNPGGLLEQGIGVAELFLDRGQNIAQLRSRSAAEPQIFTDTQPQRWPTLPLAVLIDRSTASASEIVAGALQDHDRAVVIGVTSFGKGSAQNVYPLSSGGGLRLTTARWYTPVGRSINRPIVRDADYESEEAPEPLTIPDTVRPRFRTAGGRTVFGGGGITPDLVVGDTSTPPAVQVLARSMGKNLPAYRDALALQAQRQKRSMKTPGDVVTPEMLDAVYADLTKRGVSPPRAVFDSASRWIARSLGYEMTRVTFGADADFLRRTQDDNVLQRAMRQLQKARTPREVFTGLERGGVEVRTTP